uniref:Swi5-dependent recombination DNA repair protein 1 homolog n=1 Tax=Saccoglossus kowalevskii TaxID=10224 RepID=A0ABM0N115_SACKO|nr:PREDICTED: swi5-dependent recombination DNA repair protein 1 homolog [Saccoglossus kowalevskii]
MSSSLRERLKRSRRSFYSPTNNNKQLSPGQGGPKLKDIPPTETTPIRTLADPKSELKSCQTKRRKTETNAEPVVKTVLFLAPRSSSQGRNSEELSVDRERKNTDSSPDKGNLPHLLAMRDVLQKQLSEKEETLRKLRMVKMYRTKNDLDKLESLIIKWRSASQDTLRELQDKLPMKDKPTMQELIENWHLDSKLLHFDEEVDCFKD